MAKITRQEILDYARTYPPDKRIWSSELATVLGVHPSYVGRILSEAEDFTRVPYGTPGMKKNYFLYKLPASAGKSTPAPREEIPVGYETLGRGAVYIGDTKGEVLVKKPRKKTQTAKTVDLTPIDHLALRMKACQIVRDSAPGTKFMATLLAKEVGLPNGHALGRTLTKMPELDKFSLGASAYYVRNNTVASKAKIPVHATETEIEYLSAKELNDLIDGVMGTPDVVSATPEPSPAPADPFMDAHIAESREHLEKQLKCFLPGQEAQILVLQAIHIERLEQKIRLLGGG